MAKKLLAGFFIVIIAGLGLLWYLGGRVENEELASKASLASRASNNLKGSEVLIEKRPTEDLNQNNQPDWADQLLGTKPSTPDETAVSLINQALEKKNAPLLPLEAYSTQTFTTYKLSDLLVNDQESATLMAAYAAGVKEIMTTYEQIGIGNEIELVLAVVEKGDQAAMTKLNETATRYQTSITQLLALKVPKSASGLHLNLITTLGRLAEGAAIMSQIESEPIVALSAAQMQTSRIKPALAAVGNLNIFFAAYGLPDDGQAGITS